jgi:hypothetical protein
MALQAIEITENGLGNSEPLADCRRPGCERFGFAAAQRKVLEPSQAS